MAHRTRYGLRTRMEFPNPWGRKPLSASACLWADDDDDDDDDNCSSLKRRRYFSGKFCTFYENQFLDVYSKLAALKVAPSVVSVVSYSGEEEEELFNCSGTVIGPDTVLTCATLIRSPVMGNVAAVAQNLKVVVFLQGGRSLSGEVAVFDFHYNLAIVIVKSDVPLAPVVLRRIDDSISMALGRESESQMPRRSDSFSLFPGQKVIAVGRYFRQPCDLMVASGEFSLDRCGNEYEYGGGCYDDECYECKELLRVNCRITECGIGGPLINDDAEVIGISFYDSQFIPFLPINIVIKWWEHYKKYRVCCRPKLQIDVVNLYAAQLDILDKIVRGFPAVLKGVLVEQVEARSSADIAGICPNDVIFQCDGQNVGSVLELFEIIWDKVGETVEVVVARVGYVGPLHLSMLVMDAGPDQFYVWPHLRNSR